MVKANLAQGTGVARKIDGQVAVWSAAGNTVRVFALTTAHPPGNLVTSPVDTVVAGGATARFAGCRDLLGRVSRWQPDVIYLRQCTYQPGFSSLFEIAPVIIEVNADDTTELRLVSRKSHYYNLLSRHRLLGHASALAFVTHELAASRSFTNWRVPTATIGNGISLGEVAHRAMAPRNQLPRLFFLGSPDFTWHGTDKIGLLARARPTWRFDLVGLSAPQARGLPRNVVAHGLLKSDEYMSLLADADVAISSLAMHRNRLNEASPLKTREYLASGIPVLMAYRDTDFLHGAPFLLELPNEEDNVFPNLEHIDRFVHQMRGVTVPRRDVAHLDWAHKEPARLALFERILHEGSR